MSPIVPKVLSLGYALPPHRYTQEEIFTALKYPRPFFRVFRESRIEYRYFSAPLNELVNYSFQEQQVAYHSEAIKLAKQALINCLDGRDPREVGLLVTNTCTGYIPGPVLGHYLAREFEFKPDTYIMSNVGMGCDGAFPGIRRAIDFTLSTGRQAVALAIELCSLTYFPEPDGKPDKTNDFELLRANAIFGDGCACALVGSDMSPRHPAILDTETYLDTRYLGDLGYAWRDGRLCAHISKRVPEIATGLVSIAVPKLLSRHDLSPQDIKHWVIHAAGSIVLDQIKNALALSEQQLYWSRETLRQVGNVSSATVGITAKLLMKGSSPEPGDLVVMVNIGPGMTCDSSLLRFGEQIKWV